MNNIFFVLKGLTNGERGVHALPSGAPNQPPLADGWYYLLDDDDLDGHGPYRSREDAQEAYKAASMDSLDAADIVKALLGGELKPMDDNTRQAFLDAGPRALCGEVGKFFVIVDFQDDGEVHCEAYLGEQAAFVNLAQGTWERA